MNIGSCRFLADENIHPEVIQYLKQRSLDIISINDVRLNGKPDLEILKLATQLKRVVLTQDSDFGKLVYTSTVTFLGIVYLRPGHKSPDFHIQTLNAILFENLELTPPFVLVGENKTSKVKIRLRNSIQD